MGRQSILLEKTYQCYKDASFPQDKVRIQDNSTKKFQSNFFKGCKNLTVKFV